MVPRKNENMISKVIVLLVSTIVYAAPSNADCKVAGVPVCPDTYSQCYALVDDGTQTVIPPLEIKGCNIVTSISYCAMPNNITGFKYCYKITPSGSNGT